MPGLLKEIADKKDLVFELARKDLKTRYASPRLGFLWAFLQPFFASVILFVVFSVMLKTAITEAPFFLYLMTAVFPWHFFHESVVSSSTSLLNNKNLIKESRFSHYLIPVSIVLANAVNLVPALLIMIAVSVFLMKGLSVFILALPLVVAIHFVLTLGFSIIFSVLYVRWRDVRYILEIALTFLFYMTPVFYSVKLVTDTFSPALAKIYLCNPFVSILTLYRCAIIKGYSDAGPGGLTPLLVWPAVFAAAVLFFSLYLYRKEKDRINDHLSY